MTWDEIAALSEHALNLALEQMAGRKWTHVTLRSVNEAPAIPCWESRAPDGHPTYSTVPHLHTCTSWDAVMALAWQWRISVQPTTAGRALVWYQDNAEDQRCLIVTTEHEARVAVCRLALSRAQQPAVGLAPGEGATQ